MYFNHNLVQQVPSQKYLRMHLDIKLNFQEHLDNIMSKVDKTNGLLRNPSLITIYKAFIRPHLYGDIIYDQAYRESFNQKLQSAQYNAALAITGAISGTSIEKPYHEIGLESLQKRPGYRKLCYFLKIFKVQSSDYLSKTLHSIRRAYNTKNIDNIPVSIPNTTFSGVLFTHQL